MLTLSQVLIYDPTVERWTPQRPAPCVKEQWDRDPTNTSFVHCSALNENNTDPPLPSDMRYQRWYPTTVLLPDGRFLILSGTDQDTSVGPRNASATKYRIETPEVI